MNQKELKELIEFLIEKDIAEFELERGDVKVRIKRAGEAAHAAAAPDTRFYAVQAPAIVTPETLTAPPMPAAPPAKEAPPPPFVKPGDQVTVGQILCIVEAMKLMNEIESDVAGEVVKKLVANGQPIEYGQELFAIRPKS